MSKYFLCVRFLPGMSAYGEAYIYIYNYIYIYIYGTYMFVENIQITVSSQCTSQKDVVKMDPPPAGSVDLFFMR